MELAVETEWEKIIETHLFKKCEDIKCEDINKEKVFPEKPIVEKNMHNDL